MEEEEEEGRNPHLAFSRRNDPTCLNFADCVVGVWRMLGTGLEGVWQVSYRCLAGVLRVSERCLEVVLKVSGGYLWDVRMVCWTEKVFGFNILGPKIFFGQNFFSPKIV